MDQLPHQQNLNEMMMDENNNYAYDYHTMGPSNMSYSGSGDYNMNYN